MTTRLLTTVLFMAASLCGFAQDKAKLQESTGRLMDFILKNDYQSILEITYPTLFSEISEKDYVEGLKKHNNGDDYTIVQKKTGQDIDFGPVVHFDEGYYCVIHYNYQVSIVLKNPVKKADEAATVKRFTNTLNNEDAYYIPSDNAITVKGRKSIVAVSDNSTGNFWNFIVDVHAPYAQNAIPDGAKQELHPELYSEKQNTANGNKPKAAKKPKPLQTGPLTPVQQDALTKKELAKKKQ